MRAPFILVAVAISLLSCKAKPQAPSEPPAGPDAGALRERLKALHDNTIVERAKYLSTAANVQSYRSSIAKYTREAEGIRLDERIPEQPRLGELRGAFADALAPFGIALRGWQVQVRPATQPALPDTVPEGPLPELSLAPSVACEASPPGPALRYNA